MEPKTLRTIIGRREEQTYPEVLSRTMWSVAPRVFFLWVVRSTRLETGFENPGTCLISGVNRPFPLNYTPRKRWHTYTTHVPTQVGPIVTSTRVPSATLGYLFNTDIFLQREQTDGKLLLFTQLLCEGSSFYCPT